MCILFFSIPFHSIILLWSLRVQSAHLSDFLSRKADADVVFCLLSLALPSLALKGIKRI